jgi:hypothetical protein
MTSILFLAMFLALILGACCFGLACLMKVRESRRRMIFFAASLLGFWGGCVYQLSDQISELFVTLQLGMEESVHNAFLDHWRKSGRDTPGVAVPVVLNASSRLCTAQDLASPMVRGCSLALGVNSASVCRHWVLYVPFFLPYLRPCPALRTNSDVLGDDMARKALVDAINQPCDYAPTGLDFASKRIRKALGCGETHASDKVVLIVDQVGGARTTLEMHRGSARLP